MPAETAMEMSGAGKRYGAHWVLSGLELTIAQGETVAVFGKNGSGKSTFLKMIATLVAPSAGRVFVFGQDPSKDKSKIRGRVRMLGHEKQLYDSLTARENLRLAADLLGVSSRDRDLLIRNLLDRFQIGRMADRRVGQLSEGMKKRVVLARLSLGEERSDLFLLDEPYPTLDEEGRRILDDLIMEWKKNGKTVLLSSHDHDMALRHSKRLLIIENRTIDYDGVPR